MTPPLDGIRVIDQTQALAGPYCAMILGDLGAEVIKIERPGSGDQSRTWGPPFVGGESTYYLAVNRNKRSMTLNVTHPIGKEVLYRLVDGGDVFMTNIATNASLKRYGLDYDALHARNVRLIYASISGYGRVGSRADQFGYDLVSQAESGVMSITGHPGEGPMRFPTPIADMTCGLFTAIGILAALEHRRKTGEGQMLDMSLQEGQMTWLENYAGAYFATGENPQQYGNRHPQIAPYEPLQAGDGRWFVLGVGSDNTWQKFCAVAGLEVLAHDSRFSSNADRVRNYDALMPYVREVLQRHSADEWLQILRDADVPVGKINTVAEALADSHLLERNFIVELEHPELGTLKSLATPVHMSASPLRYERHPPTLGEQTDEILHELNYSREQIQDMRAWGVV
ncbi:MAG: CoA transferase [Anaerolineae bacterium]|nr:CoA transferase [Anaerolineae bacterium]